MRFALRALGLCVLGALLWECEQPTKFAGPEKFQVPAGKSPQVIQKAVAAAAAEAGATADSDSLTGGIPTPEDLEEKAAVVVTEETLDRELSSLEREVAGDR